MRSVHGSATNPSPIAAQASATVPPGWSTAIASAGTVSPRRPTSARRPAPGVAEHVGGHDGADAQAVVERLAVRGERQDHRPAVRSPGRAARPGAPRCGPRACRCDPSPASDRCPARRPSTSAWRTCQPSATATESASAGGSSGRCRPARASRWSTPSSASTCSCQSRPGADGAAEAADAVGQPADLGVDEPGGDVVPRGVAGQRRIGQAGAHPVVQPPVELDEAGAHPGDPVVTARRRLRRRRGDAVSAAWRRPGQRRAASGAAPTPSDAGRRPAPHAVQPAGDPRRHPRRGGRGRHLPAGPQQQQRQCVLARHDAARARAAEGDADVVDDASYGSALDPEQRPHTARSSHPIPLHRAGTASGWAPASDDGRGASASTCSTAHRSSP